MAKQKFLRTKTDAEIGKFRWRLPDSEWRLKHDCLVATGSKPSPHRGGKAEAIARVQAAMAAEIVTVAKLGNAVATYVIESRERGNKDSTGTACACGHAVEEHGHDLEYPGSTACSECECIAYESEG